MGEKQTVLDWSVHLSRHLQVLAASFLECFPPDHTAELKHDIFYGGLPKWLKAMVAYLKASTKEKTYSDYLWAVREAEKEEAMEPSHSQTANNTTKHKAISFSLYRNWVALSLLRSLLYGWCTWRKRVLRKKKVLSEDLHGIEGVTEECIVCLTRAVKDPQQEEKHCYHCSRPEHFIHECPLVKASRMDWHLSQKEGTLLKKGARTPQVKVATPKASQDGMPKT